MPVKKTAVTLITVVCIALVGAVSVVTVLYVKIYSHFFSLLCVVLAIVPFFASFEMKKPRARELVPVSVMAAAAVVGRWLFTFVPSFQPATAIIIITGCAFGPSSGFMTGAVVAIASNMLLGQGIYTPWQMLCWGLCGALGGLAYNKTEFFKIPAGIALFGFLAGMIYGQIMNLVFVLGYTDRSLNAFITAAVASLPTDLIHALGNFAILLPVTAPLVRMFERIKRKYGLNLN